MEYLADTGVCVSGGVQNRSRGKEVKDGSSKSSKAREESPAGSVKREKKSGLRGIRGLV